MAAVSLFAVLFWRSAACLEVSAGVRVGLNTAAILGDTAATMAPRLGFKFEAYSTQWFGRSFGLQEGLGFDSRGYTWKNSASIDKNISTKVPNSLTYLDIPVLAKWLFIQNDNLRPALQGGVVLAFPLYAQTVLSGSTQDLYQQIHPFDFGLAAGFSLDIKRGNILIPVDIRYVWGATDFLNNADYPVALHHSVVSISVGLGWILDVGKKKEGAE